MLLLRDMLYRNANIRSQKTAIIFYEGPSMTYGELDQISNKLANALIDLGTKRGDRIAVLLHNGLEFVVAYWAAIKIGAIFLPLNVWYKAPEIIHAIHDSTSSTLILGKEFVETIVSNRDQLAPVSTYIVVADDPPAPQMLTYRHVIDYASPQRPEVEIDENDPHLILYTSGTTGVPKGAVISQRSYYLHTGVMADGLEMEEDDLYMNVYPMFHMGGPCSVLNTAYKGASLLIMSVPPTSEKILQAIQKYGVNSFVAVPTIWTRLLSHPDFDKYDLSSLKLSMGGSDAMPKDLLEQILSRTNANSPQVYGLTEGGVLTFLNAKDQRRKIGSSGKPHIQADIRIVDEEGHDVGPGEVGEIISRSEHQMLYYWNKPEETSKTVKNGWLYTGDLGRFDEDGFLYIVGRKKDMIISGGQNIYPAEVEKTILMLPQIAEVAVIGIPDKEWGESVMAVVVPREGKRLSEDEIINYVRNQMAGYNKPRYVRFVDSLPRTSATGKISKAELRKRYSEELKRA